MTFCEHNGSRATELKNILLAEREREEQGEHCCHPPPTAYISETFPKVRRKSIFQQGSVF